MGQRPRWSLLLACLGVLLGVAMLGRWIQGQLDQTLLDSRLLSGWALAVVLGLSALTWWRSAPGPRVLQRRILGQMVVGGLMLLLFLVHVKMSLPSGVLASVLSIGLEALLAGLLVGGLLVRDQATRPESLARWLRFQVSVHWGLLSLALFHGIFSHLHCAMAHYLFYAQG